MQRLLREGGQDLGFRDRCVPMPACPKFGNFPVAVGSQTRFPSDWHFRGWCGGTCGGRYARVRRVPPGTLAACSSKNKKKTGLPPGPQGGYGMGSTGYAVSGLPSGPHRPLPRLCIAQAWEDGAALGGDPRLSAGRPRAHPRRRIAGHPDQRHQVGFLWRRVGCGAESAAGRRGPVPPPMPPSPAGSGRRCTTLPPTATPTQRPRCSAPARTRPSRTAAGNAVPRRTGRPPTGRHAAGVLQEDGRGTRTK
jgi:hypothetical protein